MKGAAISAWGVWTAAGVGFDGVPPPVVPGELAAWPDAPNLSSFHRRLRRPHPSAAAVVQLAHAVLERAGHDEEMGILLGSSCGSAAADLDFFTGLKERGRAFGSPASFVYTLPSSAPTELSIALGLHGPALSVSAGRASGLTAMAMAVEEVESGRLPMCLCGQVELSSWRGQRAMAAFPGDFICLFAIAPSPGKRRVGEAQYGFDATGGGGATSSVFDVIQRTGRLRVEDPTGNWASLAIELP